MAAFRFSPNKYRAKRTDGFPSKLEASVYYLLIEKAREGKLKNIKRQQTVVLQDGPREIRITWRVDFSYEAIPSGETVYVEAKGFETTDYKLKLKMWRKNRPHTLEIYKAGGREPVLVERIEKNRDF